MEARDQANALGTLPVSTRLDRIDTRQIDFGVGVLRGVLSHPGFSSASPKIEEAVEHIRRAARAIERMQKAPARRTGRK